MTRVFGRMSETGFSSRSKEVPFAMHRFKFAALLLALCVGGLALGGIPSVATASATLHVDASGADAGNCTSSPCLTIGYAVTQAGPGDQVYVNAGTYYESITITKSVSLVSNGAVIDGTGHDNAVLIKGAAAAGTQISGFTIQNALLEGILVQQTSRITITDNTITSNDRLWNPVNVPDTCQKSDDCGEALHLMSVTDSVLSQNKVTNNVGGILLTDEMGPASRNLIINNTVADNTKDCGITLASHFFQMGSPVAAAKGGIYDNTISGNTVSNSGAAGVGIFTGPPGAAAYGNLVIGNTVTGNGLPGIAFHSHAPFQNLNDNIVRNNTVSGNGGDPDAQVAEPTGIIVFADVASGATPLARIEISSNKITGETNGIYFVGTTADPDLSSNSIGTDVENPIVMPEAGAPQQPAPQQPGAGGSPAITPPNTGDGGLKTDGTGAYVPFLAAAFVLFALGLQFSARVDRKR